MATRVWVASNGQMTAIIEGADSAAEAATLGAEQFGDPPEGWRAIELTPTQARELLGDDVPR